MLSQSPGIYILLGSVLSAILSSVISGIMLLTGNYLNNKSQLKREEKQHTWQVEREEKQRTCQEESDQRKWYREKIYDGYRTSIQALTKISQIQFKINKNNIPNEDILHANLVDLTLEFLSEFNIIMIGHPEKDSDELVEKTNKMIEGLMDKNTRIALEIMREIMDNDSRIKNINK